MKLPNNAFLRRNPSSFSGTWLYIKRWGILHSSQSHWIVQKNKVRLSRVSLAKSRSFQGDSRSKQKAVAEMLAPCWLALKKQTSLLKRGPGGRECWGASRKWGPQPLKYKDLILPIITRCLKRNPSSWKACSPVSIFTTALTHMAQLLGVILCTKEFPVQFLVNLTCLGCELSPGGRRRGGACRKQLINVLLSHHFFSFSFPPLSLEINRGRGKSIRRPWTKHPLKLCLDSWPRKLWNTECTLFEVAKSVIFCHIVTETNIGSQVIVSPRRKTEDCSSENDTCNSRVSQKFS